MSRTRGVRVAEPEMQLALRLLDSDSDSGFERNMSQDAEVLDLERNVATLEGENNRLREMLNLKQETESVPNSPEDHGTFDIEKATDTMNSADWCWNDNLNWQEINVQSRGSNMSNRFPRNLRKTKIKICAVCNATFTNKWEFKMHMWEEHMQSGNHTRQEKAVQVVSTNDSEPIPIQMSEQIEEDESEQHDIHVSWLSQDDGIVLVDPIHRVSFQSKPKVVNEKIFRCKLCDKTLTLHQNLKRHVREVHKAVYYDAKYACKRCAAKFHKWVDLIKHSKTHLKYELNGR